MKIPIVHCVFCGRIQKYPICEPPYSADISRKMCINCNAFGLSRSFPSETPEKFSSKSKDIYRKRDE